MVPNCTRRRDRSTPVRDGSTTERRCGWRESNEKEAADCCRCQLPFPYSTSVPSLNIFKCDPAVKSFDVHRLNPPSQRAHTHTPPFAGRSFHRRPDCGCFDRSTGGIEVSFFTVSQFFLLFGSDARIFISVNHHHTFDCSACLSSFPLTK